MAPFILVVFGGLFVAATRAGGKAFCYDDVGMRPLPERTQSAIIDHADGRQRMRLAVWIDLPGDKGQDARGVWLFPVRGRGGAVRVKLLNEYSTLRGRNIVHVADGRLGDWYFWTLSWAVLPCCCIPSMGSFDPSGALTISDAIETFGMRCEVLSTNDMDALVAHLTAAGVRVDNEQLSTFGPYLNADHSLVAVWIRSVAEFRAEFDRTADHAPRLRDTRTPCVEVEFPSDKPWFPLRASFTPRPNRPHYSTDNVELRLQVRGWVEAHTGSSPSVIAGDGQYCWIDATAAERVGMNSSDRRETKLRYTSFTSERAPNEFTADLEFVPTTSRRPARAALISGLPQDACRVLLVLTIALLSASSGAVAGWLMMRRPLAGAALGLANLGTFVALLFALRNSHHMCAARRDGTSEAAQKLSFAVIFYLVYMLLAHTTHFVLSHLVGA